MRRNSQSLVSFISPFSLLLFQFSFFSLFPFCFRSSAVFLPQFDPPVLVSPVLTLALTLHITLTLTLHVTLTLTLHITLTLHVTLTLTTTLIPNPTSYLEP